jgi:hypothetical protein
LELSQLLRAGKTDPQVLFQIPALRQHQTAVEILREEVDVTRLHGAPASANATYWDLNI